MRTGAADDPSKIQFDAASEHQWSDGRIGVITTSADFLGRLVLICPETEDESQFVVYIASPLKDGLYESFWQASQIQDVINDLGIVWICRSPQEADVERAVFSIRDEYARRLDRQLPWYRRMFRSIKRKPSSTED